MNRPLAQPVRSEAETLRPPARSGRITQPVPAWAETLTRWLDDIIRIPGTKIGVGLDAIVGFLLPGAGDAITALGSVSLLFLALRSGVPTVVIARMLLNIGIDALVGAVPIVGDLFDVAWKANRKNLELIQHYRGNSDAKPGTGDYLLVGLGLLLALLSVALPILFLIGVGVGFGSLSR
jgi:hypothetical protein